MNIIITGASSGMGYYTAISLASMPDNNIIAIARRGENLNKLKTESNGNILPLIFDLENGDFEKLYEQIKSIFKISDGNKVDILINNAGYLDNKLFIEITDNEWLKVFNINFLSNVKLIRGLYPFFNRSQGSHIVNIGSMGGVLGTAKFKGLSAYSATKAALNSLTESLAVEFDAENIHVNSINPGAVQTPMLEKAFPNFKAKVSPQEMGEYIASFALNNGKLMNGRITQVSMES